MAVGVSTSVDGGRGLRYHRRMPTKRSHVRVHAAADTVWSLIRDPQRWPWFPELGEMTMDGDRRHVTLPSGLQIGRAHV